VVDNVVDPALLNRDSVLGPDGPFTMLTLGASIVFTTRPALRLLGVKMHRVIKPWSPDLRGEGCDRRSRR
jgi:hypothetical protein